MYIKDETDVLIKKRQVWLVTGKPKSNTTHATIIDVPVTYTARPSNVTSVIRNIVNDANLTVALERFAPDE
jgi:hypothetical protein